MSDKTLHPNCSPPIVTDNCFNVDTQKLVIGGVSLRDQVYSKVIDLERYSYPSNYSIDGPFVSPVESVVVGRSFLLSWQDPVSKIRCFF